MAKEYEYYEDIEPLDMRHHVFQTLDALRYVPRAEEKGVIYANKGRWLNKSHLSVFVTGDYSTNDKQRTLVSIMARPFFTWFPSRNSGAIRNFFRTLNMILREETTPPITLEHFDPERRTREEEY